ncbi:MAG: PHB depolymerase family esterase [Pirellulales bacterium]
MSQPRQVLFILFWLCLRGTMPATAGEPRTGEFAAERLLVRDVSREYRLVVPKSVDLAKPAPLVIAFHGMLIDSKDLMPRYTKLNQTAEKYKFILAYPNAIDRSWVLADDKIKRDLAFFDALLERLSFDHQIDSQRVYVTGMSNGGYFAHLVAKERSTVVAAVASHSGTLGLQTLLGVNADRKFPVLIIHGSRDQILPVAWARENRDKYKREGHAVQYVELPGQGHLWGASAGVNDTIWKFFDQHPLDE